MRQIETDFSKMASSAIDIEKSQISKMSEIDLVNSGSGELITGFSTPPSSSLDNCDSGFNDLYSNNFSLLSSGNMKGAQTTPVQTDQSDSSPESAQLFDDNSIAGEFGCVCLLHSISIHFFFILNSFGESAFNFEL